MIRTKVFALLAAALLLLTGMAYAEEALPDRLITLLKEVYPSHAIQKADQCGNSAAVILSDGHSRVLCLAEMENDEWKLAAANAKALPQEADIISLLLDTDDTLFWTYENEVDGRINYHAVRSDGRWHVVSRM